MVFIYVFSLSFSADGTVWNFWFGHNFLCRVFFLLINIHIFPLKSLYLIVCRYRCETSTHFSSITLFFLYICFRFVFLCPLLSSLSNSASHSSGFGNFCFLPFHLFLSVCCSSTFALFCAFFWIICFWYIKRSIKHVLQKAIVMVALNEFCLLHLWQSFIFVHCIDLCSI